MIRYSVVIPAFNEELVIKESYRRLTEVMQTTDEAYELLFINDGSRDKTPVLLNELAEQDEHVRVIHFSRNFGHQTAVSAGMDYAEGQAVVIIDADLQDPPEVILTMIDKWKEGYDVVYGKRLQRRGETWFKKVTAKAFYRFLNRMTAVEIPVDAGDFRLIDRKVCDVMKGLTEKNRYVRGLVSWTGFRQTAVEYVREERFAGETKYSLRRMVKLAADATIAFSYKPLRLAGFMGIGLSLASFVYLIIIICQKLFTDSTVPGWTSLIAVVLFSNGVSLLLSSISGEYIGRIYEETKNRPLYIISEMKGFNCEKLW